MMAKNEENDSNKDNLKNANMKVRVRTGSKTRSCFQETKCLSQPQLEGRAVVTLLGFNEK